MSDPKEQVERGHLVNWHTLLPGTNAMSEWKRTMTSEQIDTIHELMKACWARNEKLSCVLLAKLIASDISLKRPPGPTVKDTGF